MFSKRSPLSLAENALLWQRIWDKEKGKLTDATPSLDSNGQQILEALLHEMPNPTGRKAIELGCGTGRISLGLAQAGADTYLLDIVSGALDLACHAFRHGGHRGTAVQASVLEIPLGSATFDLVWNSGVLEHFHHEHQITALAEMGRICKRSGKVIVIVPYSRAPVYRLGKWYADRTATFEFGYERPMRTLAQHLKPDMSLRLCKEYTLGFVSQVHFLGYIPVLRPLAKAMFFLERWFLSPLNRLPFGWLLVSVFEKV